MKNPVYLDYNATTPCSKSVLDAMTPCFKELYGNASSQHHSFGWLASEAIEKATNSIAQDLRIKPNEIIYTSGSTESINTIIKGVYRKNKIKKNQIITVKTEHKAVLDVCALLEKEDAEITYLKVDKNGLISLEELEKTITNKTSIVSIMLANNETGVLQDINYIGEICKKKGALLFSDITQALGKINLKDIFFNVDFACFSAHKIFGPKGIGLTYIKTESKAHLDSFIQGGGQQRNLRGGTYNTPSIVGFSIAIKKSVQNIHFNNRIAKLRDYMQEKLLEIEGTKINGVEVDRLPNTLNISFDYVDGEKLLFALSQKIAVSNGSACNSSSVHPSHVLKAMGLNNNLAFSSLRISLGITTSKTEINIAIAHIKESIELLRNNNSLWINRSI